MKSLFLKIHQSIYHIGWLLLIRLNKVGLSVLILSRLFITESPEDTGIKSYSYGAGLLEIAWFGLGICKVHLLLYTKKGIGQG